MFDLRDHVAEAMKDRYAVVRELKRGGMTIDYLAEDLTHRPVVLTVLRPEVSVALSVEWFLHGRTRRARLIHALIVPVREALDSGATAQYLLSQDGEAACPESPVPSAERIRAFPNGMLYYILPKVQDETLRDRLRRQELLSLEDVLILAQEVAARGESATVYAATDVRQEHPIVLGTTVDEGTDDAGGVGKGMALVATFDHPNLTKVLDVGEAAGLLYSVTARADGETLRTLLEQEARLPVEDALRIACGVADALEYAHRRGVLHYALRPENILLRGTDPIVAETGIMQVFEDWRAWGEEVGLFDHVACGTPPYMSPEQAVGAGTVDGRSDLFSLGCIVYEMLTGRPPVSGPERAVTGERVPRVSTLRKGIPRRADRALDRVLRLAPADRYATAAEFAEALGVCR